MRVIILLFMISLPVSGVYSQEVPGLRDVIIDTGAYIPVYKYRSVGASYFTSRDRALSPLVFSGPGLTFSASSWKHNNNWLWQSNFDARLSILKNEPGSSVINEMGFGYQFTALRELVGLQCNNWRFWVGPEARMLLNTRIHSRNTNNIASYDWATSLGGSAMVSTHFKIWKWNFAVSNQLQLPLGFIYARPPFAWALQPAIFEEQKGGWKEAFEVGTLNNIFLIANQVNLDFYLNRKKNKKLVQKSAYRLAYSWSYFQITTYNRVQSGGHILNLSKVITF